MLTSLIFFLTSNIPVSLLIFLLLFFLTRTKQSELCQVPGPPPLPILGNSLLFSGPSENVWLPTLKMLRKKYGPVVRFSFGSMVGIFIFGPNEFEKILSSNVHITKGFRFKFLCPWLGQGLLTSDGPHWKTHRKLLTTAFHFRILEDFLHMMNNHAKILCNILKTVPAGEPVNIYTLITNCTLDIICETAMGIQMDCQSGCNSQYVKAVYDCQSCVFQRAISPWLWNDFIFGFTPCGKKMAKCLNVIHNFIENIIKKRKLAFEGEASKKIEESVDDIGRKQRLSFLDLLIKTSKDENDLTDKDIRDEVDTFMFAGHDTTASNISLTLYLLAYHTEAQSKCHQELDEIFLHSDRPASSTDLTKMKYLHCCIKETLRLYGSVPAMQRVTGEPVELGGHLIPTNTEIFLNMAILHRDPQAFPDPEKFIPERFLDETGRHPYAYVPFSAGPRNCIGQKFAVMEEKAVLSAVLRNFNFHTSLPIEEVPLIPEGVLKPKDGLFIQLQHRK